MEDYGKICTKCSLRFPGQAIVCAYCSSELALADSPPRKSARFKTNWGLIFFVLAGTIIAWLVFSLATDTPSHKDDGQPAFSGMPDTQPSNLSTAMPPSIAFSQGRPIVTVTPWELLKNPYLQQGKIVRLDHQAFPLVSRGNVMRYQRCGNGRPDCQMLGLVGLRFNRMFSARQALYDVMAQAVEEGGDIGKTGEILVDIDGSEDQPPLDRDWIVVPEQPTSGTNAFGANLSVATIRFLRAVNASHIEDTVRGNPQ